MMKQTKFTKSVCIFLCLFIVLTQVSILTVTADSGTDSEDNIEYTIENGLITSSYVDNNKLADYYYNENGYRIKKVCSERIEEYNYDEHGSLSSIAIIIGSNRYELEYNYNYDNNIPILENIMYSGSTYTILRDSTNNIIGLLNEENIQVVRYVYEGAVLENVFEVTEYGDVINHNQNFVGNLNGICWQDAYYDYESGLYYKYRRYYNPAEGLYITGLNKANLYTEINPFINDKLRSWEDSELYAEEWKLELMSDSSHGRALDYSESWYASLSTVEILSRLIYAENSSSYMEERKGVAYVIMNRIEANKTDSFGEGLRGVATKTEQFSTIAPACKTKEEKKEAITSTAIARNPLKSGAATQIDYMNWEHATFLACLLCTTLDQYEWSVISSRPSGITNQLYFVSYNSAINSGKFRDSSGGIQYYSNYVWINVHQVAICGYGVFNSVADIKATNTGSTNRNIFYNK